MRPAAALMVVKDLVFGSGEHDASEDDRIVEKLLETISNGTLAADRRASMEELHQLLEESGPAQLAFGTMGFPVLLAVLREERDDLDLVRGALETLVTATNPMEATQDEHGQILPWIVNCEVLAREHDIVALFLSFLEEDDFYVRYYALKLLTSLLSVSPSKLQDEILATPQGITRLMDMMLEGEVIRNEALLLFVNLTRAAKEIQKIVVFEGAFERLFNIIKGEGGSDGGPVVQDCLELLNNLLRNNPSNQVFLRETIGLQNITSFLKLRRGGFDGSEQKSVNLLCGLETVSLLLAGAENLQPGKDSNVVANQTLLAQSNVLDALLTLSVEGRISAVATRCRALKCIGDLVNGHPNNRDLLSSKLVGDDAAPEPAMVCILRALLRTPNLNECIAAEYVIKCFCEGNLIGQTMLASTITPLPQSTGRTESDRNTSFGSMLVQALIGIDGRNDLEASCRAASVLSHILKNNVDCKKRVLTIPLEVPSSRLATPEYLLPRCMRYLAAASSSAGSFDSKESIATAWLQPVLLRLLVTWLAECPPAVAAFLDTPTHLPFLVELVSSAGTSTSVHVAGLSAVLLGECIVYNEEEPSATSGKDAGTVSDIVTHRIGLRVFYSKWEEMKESGLFVAASAPSRLPVPLTRTTAAAVAAGDGFIGASSKESWESSEPAVTLFYDAPFVQFINELEPVVRQRMTELYSNPRSADRKTLELSRCEPRAEESLSEYAARANVLIQSMAQELQDLLARNSLLTKELLVTSSGESSGSDSSAGQRNLVILQSENEGLKRNLQEAIEQLREEKQRESEWESCKQQSEAELQSLSDAYYDLERVNQSSEMRVKELEARVAELEGKVKESEGELSDLLVCLGQEEGKFEKLVARLEEQGIDAAPLLEGIAENEAEEDDEDDDQED